MLKKFFISMLGTIAGLWIAIFLVFLGGLMLIGAIAGESDTKEVKKHSILYLDLSGDIAERYQPASLMDMLQDIENGAPSLDEMKAALNAAARDHRIDAVFLDCAGSGMAMASRQELIEALEDFKVNSNGKPVYAYADSYSQGDYLLATTADSIFLNPIGSVDIHGLGGATPFFKNALDKLGVKMQIIKVGTFKSAVEPYILTEMSEPARLQMQQYCDSLWGYAATRIADARNIEQDSVRAWASELIFTRPAQEMVEMGLVDRLAYRRSVDSALREITGLNDDEDLRLVAPSELLLVADLTSTLNREKPHIAVLYAVGEIYDSGSEGIVGPDMVDEIIALADDDNVRGMVFRINSPGGSAFASEQIWEALQYFKSKNKPLYVSMGDYAASGGYYISCGADRIYADETTITGSIGVFGMIPDLSGLVTDKLGVDFSTVETNPNAAGISYFAPMTPEQQAAMQGYVEDTYATFTGRVASGRDLPVDSVRAIAEGRVWVGSKALELGLVDRLGSLADAIDAMSAETGISADKAIAYPETEDDIWLTVLRQSGLQGELKAGTGLDELDAETLGYLRTLRRLRTMNPVQARMEPVTIK